MAMRNSRHVVAQKSPPLGLFACVLTAVLLSAAGWITAADPPPRPPAEFLARPVGTDFKLADWSQIVGYIEELDERSPAVRVERVGKTTEGRDLRIVIISSPQNLERLDELKAISKRLADPRGLKRAERDALIEQARLFLFISATIHSTEVAAAEMSLQLAYDLATKHAEPWATTRREMVVVLIPSVNPDGLERVVRWYRKIRGTPYEAARLPELYQTYAGHDNNRDWFLLSLAETRIVTRLLYREWFPHVYWDVHQQGPYRERLFVPPFRDPLNPNLDPEIMAAIGTLGARMMYDLTQAGFSGVATGVTYDMWWNGGNRNVPVRHNMIGFLSEAASANLASPLFIPRERLEGPRGLKNGYAASNQFPKPWPGGWWRVGDIVKYELALAESILGSLSREPKLFMSTTAAAAQRAVEQGEKDVPRTWLIPSPAGDRGGLKRMIATLLDGGVEVDVALEGFTVSGRPFRRGTAVVRRAQPYGNYAKDLLELQQYPDGLPPYDVTGWTLPLLMGVTVIAMNEALEVPTRRVESAQDLLALRPKGVRLSSPLHLDGADSDSYRGVITLLQARLPLLFDARPDSAVSGSWILPGKKSQREEALAHLRELGLEVDGDVASPLTLSADDAAVSRDLLIKLERLPRVGLYAPWTANKDEGWLRWMFDRFDLPYVTMRNEQMRSHNLHELVDVIVVPSVRPDVLRDGRHEGEVFPQYAGGIGRAGAVALDAFVRRGGTLICIDESTLYAIELFDLPLTDATASQDETSSFSCPGSILRTVTKSASPFVVSLPTSQPVYFSSSRAFRVDELQPNAGMVLLEYPRDNILLSGYLGGSDEIAGTAAWVRTPVGDGAVHLFGFRPHYRSWTQTTFKLLLRAILLDAPTFIGEREAAEANTKE